MTTMGSMHDDDFPDLKALRLDPAVLAAPRIPAKIGKRRDQFIIVPMAWYEKLAKPVPKSRCTCLVALYLLHLHWKSDGKPFKLANGMLEYDGVSRFSKVRALRDLERRELIRVEWRGRKSPIVQVLGC
jgi:hypothetical protein